MIVSASSTNGVPAKPVLRSGGPRPGPARRAARRPLPARRRRAGRTRSRARRRSRVARTMPAVAHVLRAEAPSREAVARAARTQRHPSLAAEHARPSRPSAIGSAVRRRPSRPRSGRRLAAAGVVGRRVRIEPVAELEPGVPQPGRREQRARRAERARSSSGYASRSVAGRRTPPTAPTAPRPRRRPRSPWLSGRRKPGSRRTSGRRARRTARRPASLGARARGRRASRRRNASTSKRNAAVGANDGEVAGPAEPLVALRAVGGHVEEVAAHAPHDVAVQLVEQRVGALERSRCGARSECDDDRRERRRRSSSPGQPVDLGVAEAVEGERRLEHVVAAAEDEAVGRLRACAAGGCRARRPRAPRRAAA